MLYWRDFNLAIPHQNFHHTCSLCIHVDLSIRYLRLFGVPPVTYESASMRQFYKGRTDVIRPSTNDALTFVKTMVNPTATVSAQCTGHYTLCSRTSEWRTHQRQYNFSRIILVEILTLNWITLAPCREVCMTVSLSQRVHCQIVQQRYYIYYHWYVGSREEEDYGCCYSGTLCLCPWCESAQL